jgi:sulfatase maturation enzyme AslB (radical SAM superfamily)
MLQMTTTPYCKVCHDAGKSEAEYRSHFIREAPLSTSQVVCPALDCRYCFIPEHTIKYCPTLKKYQYKNISTNSKATIKSPTSKKSQTPRSNLFDCLIME